jgi:hypothetical protein
VCNLPAFGKGRTTFVQALWAAETGLFSIVVELPLE